MTSLLAAAGPLLPTSGIVGTVVMIIAVIIGGGLLIWALKLAITNFLDQAYQGKAIAVMYIVIAIILAALVFHWAGLY